MQICSQKNSMNGRRRRMPVCRRPFFGAESLESRVLLTSLTGTDIAGGWVLAGTQLTGTINFNDSSGITGGSLTDSGDNTTTPAGSYDLSTNGALAMDLNGLSESGGMNSRHDVIAITQTDSANTLAVLTNGGATVFNNASLDGTWSLSFDNTADGHSGGGIVTFNGKGAITGGGLVSGEGSSTVTGGSYAVATDGSVTVTIKIKTGSKNSSFDFTGGLNASDDTLAVNNTDLETADETGRPNLILLVKSSGKYSKGSLSGDFAFNGELGEGTLDFNGAGSITGGTFTSNQDEAVTIQGGTYSVNDFGSGTMQMDVQYELSGPSGGTITDAIFNGAINGSDNVAFGYSTFATPFGNVVALTSDVNHAPTLSSMKPFATAQGNSAFDITYGQLTANAVGLNDLDGDTIDFRVDSGASGAVFAVNGTTQNSFPFEVSPGQTLSVTLPANASGKVDAFNVEAFDGALTSATDVPVVISAIPEPTVSVVTTVGTGNEVNNGEKGIGKITFTRTGPTDLPLEVNYSVSGRGQRRHELQLAFAVGDHSAGAIEHNGAGDSV